MRGKKLLYTRASRDPILRAVIAEINKSAVKPDPGFMRLEDWGKKWDLVDSQAAVYIKIAIKKGIMECRKFRVVTNGRLMMMKHYGEVKPENHKRACHKRRTKL